MQLGEADGVVCMSCCLVVWLGGGECRVAAVVIAVILQCGSVTAPSCVYS